MNMVSNEFEKLGGSTEVAALLGVSKQQFTQLRTHPDFPPPYVELASGPIWKLEHIRRWMKSSGRRSRGRPSTSNQRIIGKRFELEESAIGSGGFADVYRAVDRLGVALDKNSVVAVKILKSSIGDEANARMRFIREVRLLQDTKHPNVMQILAWGKEDEDGNPWYAMPLAQGSLEDHLEFIADDHEIIEVMEQVCSGLQYLHDLGIIHRDLKPMNVLLTQSATWAISDFGLAREIERNTPSLTSSTAIFGTPYYMAPEVEEGVKFVGVQADIYSLGMMLQALVLAKSHLSLRNPIPPSPFRPIIQKAIEYKPEDRYSNVEEMLAAVKLINTAPHEITNDIFYRLRERVTENDVEALKELINLVLQFDKIHLAFGTDTFDLEPDKQVFITMARLTKDAIAYLWEHNRVDFQEAFKRFAKHITAKAYPFELCDILADFAQSVVNVTQDNEVLKATVEGLCELGFSHNRWHVRSVLLKILQEIHTTEEAIVALDALNVVKKGFRGRSAVEWFLVDDPFLVRSFHPALRKGIQELLEKRNNQEDSLMETSGDDFSLEKINF